MTHFIPIALILGSDNKPAKVRIAEIDVDKYSTNNVFDAWLLNGQWVTLDESDSQAFSLHPFRIYNQWVFPCYSWLPTLDMYNNVVKDGLILCRVISQGFYTDTYEEKSTLKERVLVLDAFGRLQGYPVEKIFDIVKRDKKHKLFCNLDYARVDTVASMIYAVYPKYLALLDTELSADLQGLNNFSSAFNYELDEMGDICPNKEMGYSKSIIIPDSWKSVKMSIDDSSVEVISFPKEMYYLSLYIRGCRNLRELILPRVIYRRSNVVSLDVTISFCDCLKEIILPRNCNNMSVWVERCYGLERIKAASFVNGTKGKFKRNKAKVFSMECPKLKVQVNEGWRII